MIKSYRRLRRERAYAINKKRGVASQRVQAESRLTREVDCDTLRSRALHDARGQVLRHGCTYNANETTQWRVVRSVHGRTNQRDVITNGALWRTCGPRKLPAWLR